MQRKVNVTNISVSIFHIQKQTKVSFVHRAAFYIFHFLKPATLGDDRSEVQMYHNFANLFSKLSESTFYKEISKFQLKV